LTASNGRVVVGPTSTFSGDVTTSATGRVDNGGGGGHMGRVCKDGVVSGAGGLTGTLLHPGPRGPARAAGAGAAGQSPTAHTNAGLVEVLGNSSSQATFETVGPITNASGGNGLIVARNASLRFDGGLTNQAALSMNFGLTDVFGKVNNVAGGNIAIA